MRRTIPFLALAAASVLALAGCTGSPLPQPTYEPGDTRVQVVASTTVYGSLAEQIGGDRVEVTSIITSVTQDPHSYEATARDRLAVSNAQLVIENGGGYDPFMQRLREGSGAHVVTAVEFSHDYPGGEGHGHDDHDDDHADDHDHDDDDHADDHEGHNHIEGFNEHVWFDVHTMIHVVEAIAEELGEIDPAGADQFTAAAEAITSDLRDLEAQTKTLKGEFEGVWVFITEPLPGYLAESLGLVDITPEGFSEAVEEGTEVPPQTMLAAMRVFTRPVQAEVLLTNAQTGGAETTAVENAAKEAGVPIVAFTELLPEGKTYAEWMQDAITSLATALRS